MPKRVKVDWRVKGGKKPENVKLVTRGTRFGNPYIVGIAAPDAATAVAMFREWIEGDTIGARLTRGRVEKHLRGFDLACYCALDQPCHADVLLEIANQ